MSQDIFTDGGASGWSLDWTDSPLRTLGELRRRAFWFYMKCVGLYTGRNLTKPKDILTAFQGTSWLLQQHLNTPLFYGLPVSHFDLALLWMPLVVLNRRKQKGLHRSRAGLCSQDELGHCNCKLDERGYGGKEFPSWSWCGWIGGKAGYQLDMIEGCLLNVREWLKNHTWISWYVRDYKGNLRPLWDKRVLGEDLSEEASRKGYSGRTSSRVQRPAQSRHSRHRSHRYGSLRPTPHEREKVFSNDSGPPHMRPRSYAYPAQVPYQPKFTPGLAYPPQFGPPQPTAYAPPMPSPYVFAPPPQPTPNKKSRRPHKLGVKSKSRSKHNAEEWKRQSNRQRPRASYYVDEDEVSSRLKSCMISSQEAAGTSSKRRGLVPPKRASTFQPYGTMSPPPPPPPPQVYVKKPLRASLTTSSTSDNTDDEVGDEYFSSDERGHDEWGEVSSDGENSHFGEVFVPRNDCPIVKASSETSDRGGEENHNRHNRRSGVHDEDVHGRPVRPTVEQGTVFTGILPDNPFGIARGPFPKGKRDQLPAMPILQFWTWSTGLFVTIRESQTLATSINGLCQCNIVDKAGDWCGSIVLPRVWITDRQGIPLLFIAISDAKSLTSEECPVWNHYIPKDKEESEWDLYYVLLLDRNRERALWERIGLGKVFQAAFGEAVWDEIKLG